MPELHPTIQSELTELHATLCADGTIPSKELLQRYHDAFRREFGPEVLRSLDGQELLERMHAHGNRDSLVYWLEFKDDETFPAKFGSIAGGSALKFGVYRRAETGTWATKGAGSAPRDISVAQAIDIARLHRDQLLAAIDVVAEVPEDADDARYLRLQRDLTRVAPDVEDTAWGHKYLSLLFPDVLDDFHVSSYQRHHLIRLLELPPRSDDGWADGRYVCAGRFASVARALGISLHDTTTILNRRNGSPRSYWRIGTTDGTGERRKYWPMMREGDVVAIGWPKLGDLSDHAYNQESKVVIAAILQQLYPNTPQAIGRSATQILKFVGGMSEGDRVVAADGQTVVGIGEIVGPYRHEPSAPFPHQRQVTWRSFAEWQTVDAEALRTTVGTIKDPRNQVEIERHILDDAGSVRAKPRAVANRSGAVATSGSRTPRGPLRRLGGISGHIQTVLERKGQVILYGPPGTGKTHWALRTARELAALRAFGSGFAELKPDERTRVTEGLEGAPPLVRIASFHPEYGYEDFIEGYRPRIAPDGSLAFALVPGIFRRLCSDAAASTDLDFHLVIDEINRGDVPRIFGELLTLLERDKRGERVILPASGESIRVPPNVHVLGTMNTADRSIALLDVALRRRFGFVELMPEYSLLQGTVVGGLPLGPWLADLNARVRATGGGDARNRQIGHAFLLGQGGSPISSIEQLAAVLRDDIVPLLEEYAYEDFGQLAEVLGRGLIDETAQRVRAELFEAGRGEELIAALSRPEIVTAAAAVASPAQDSDLLDDEDLENDADEGSGDGAQTRTTNSSAPAA